MIGERFIEQPRELRQIIYSLILLVIILLASRTNYAQCHDLLLKEICK